MKFLEGAPIFAADVRSEHDDRSIAERKMTQKRADCLACGTLVVWDVDLPSDDVVRSYRSDQPDTPTIVQRGEMAHAEPAVMGWTAEPAVMGWTLEVNELFS